MSSMGTGPTAGVAQTALNAQQVARQRDKKVRDEKHQSERIKDTFETHLRAVEEGDEAEAPSQLRLDQQVPQHEHNGNPVDPSPRHTRDEQSDDKPDHKDDNEDRPRLDIRA